MPDHVLDVPAYEEFRSELYASGMLVETGVDGLYGRSAAYEQLIDDLHATVSRRIVPPDATRLSFPPLLSRSVFDRTDYLSSFPDLMGSVHTFRGSDQEHVELIRRVNEGSDWAGCLVPADVVLSSAACHPLYPLSTGQLDSGGRYYEVAGYCFRCEPSIDPSRMQAFRMQESVYIGEPDLAEQHRDNGLDRGIALLEQLELEVKAVVANDPFFGRVGSMLAANQVDEQLKVEVVTPICSDVRPTAIMSANCHRDHFGRPFAIETSTGAVAHSACVAFGLDRIALGLLRTHGLDRAHWPQHVNGCLAT